MRLTKQFLFGVPFLLLSIVSTLQISFAALNESRVTQQINKSLADKRTPVAVEKPEDPIAALAEKGYEFIFFVSGRCDYCHQLAPTVKAIADQYGFEVFLISFDGEAVAPFTEAMLVTKTLYQRFYQNQSPFAPMLFLHNKHDKRFMPLAEGFTSPEKIVAELQKYAAIGGFVQWQ